MGIQTYFMGTPDLLSIFVINLFETWIFPWKIDVCAGRRIEGIICRETIGEWQCGGRGRNCSPCVQIVVLG